MALIKCVECGKDVSSRAISCPNCGNPISTSANSTHAAASNLEEILKLHKLAEKGDPNSQYRLSEKYEYGWGIEEDKDVALRWLKKAAEQGHEEAQYEMGNRKSFGENEDKEEACKWYKKAAEHYKKAAEQGDAEAQYKIGFLYSLCEGVESEFLNEESIKWYKKAAEQGNAQAQYEMGEIYFEGYGVRQDDALAIEWFKDAAKQGHEEALSKLKTMLYILEKQSETFDTFEQGDDGSLYSIDDGDKEWLISKIECVLNDIEQIKDG
jgi:TPR repeat protein